MIVSATSIVETLPADRAGIAQAVRRRWQESLEAILDVGRMLAQAKEALPHGEFTAMVETDLPFGARTAQRLMVVAADERLANPTHVSYLPPAWGTLYELTRLDDEAFDARIADGTIRPDMERRDVAQVVKRDRRAAREVALADKVAALPAERFAVIYADPEWRFEPRSRASGLDRAADNHYPTSELDTIKARPVSDLAADDCVLFLWATAPMLPAALEVMAAWGFAYKSHVVWRKIAPRSGEARKLRLGTGYWFRNAHELLLVGTRGDVPAPAPGTQIPSVCDAELEAHSAKPESFLAFIEEMFPTVPKIELNRRGPPRPGWSAWGNEATTGQEPATGAARSGIEEARSATEQESVEVPEAPTGTQTEEEADEQSDHP